MKAQAQIIPHYLTVSQFNSSTISRKKRPLNVDHLLVFSEAIVSF